MNVSDLRAALADLPDDMPVVMAKDAEGNGYSPLAKADDVAMYAATCTWAGDRYLTPQAHAEADPGEWDEAPESAVRALFLWPVN